MNTLAVCDTEKDFGEQLADYAAGKAGYPFELQLFSSLEQLKDYLGSHMPEAVLLGEELYSQRDWEDFSNPLFLLGNGIGEEAGATRIFRYQEAEHILQELLTLYCRQVPQVATGASKSSFRIYAVADAGESWRSAALAFELAAWLGEREKVLWLDLRTWSVTETFTHQPPRGDLGELLYYLCRRRGDLIPRLLSEVTTCRGVDMLPGANVPEDLLTVQAGDWKYFFEQVKTGSRYTAVVAVTGNGIQPLGDFLELCDAVWLVWEQEQAPCEKRMEQYIGARLGNRLCRRMRCIQLPPGLSGEAAEQAALRQLVIKAQQEETA